GPAPERVAEFRHLDAARLRPLFPGAAGDAGAGAVRHRNDRDLPGQTAAGLVPAGGAGRGDHSVHGRAQHAPALAAAGAALRTGHLVLPAGTGSRLADAKEAADTGCPKAVATLAPYGLATVGSHRSC